MDTLRPQDASLPSPDSRSPSTKHETAENRRDAPSSASDVTGPVESLIRRIGINKIYGAPITSGRTTVVPVAELRTGFGYGTGADAENAGGGGGAGLRLIPRGYLQITPEGVRYRPIYDVGPLVAGGAFAGWLLYRLLSRWTS